MYAVTGSTGQVGGAVVRALLAAGKEVRAVYWDESESGDLESMGAEPFQASVEDGARMEMAFENVEAVFVVTPSLLKAPNPRGEHKLALAAIGHALQATHVSKVIFLSFIGAQLAEGTGAILKLHDLEQEIFSLPISAASIRAANFMENYLNLMPQAKETGKLPVTLGPLDRAFSLVASEDVGKLAARLLMEEWSGKRTIELEGPEQYSMQDAAAILSKTLGRTVTPELVPHEQRQGAYEKLGSTPGAAQALVQMADAFESGLAVFAGGDEVEHMRGTTTLEDVLKGAGKAPRGNTSAWMKG